MSFAAEGRWQQARFLVYLSPYFQYFPVVKSLFQFSYCKENTLFEPKSAMNNKTTLHPDLQNPYWEQVIGVKIKGAHTKISVYRVRAFYL